MPVVVNSAASLNAIGEEPPLKIEPTFYSPSLQKRAERCYFSYPLLYIILPGQEVSIAERAASIYTAIGEDAPQVLERHQPPTQFTA